MRDRLLLLHQIPATHTSRKEQNQSILSVVVNSKRENEEDTSLLSLPFKAHQPETVYSLEREPERGLLSEAREEP